MNPYKQIWVALLVLIAIPVWAQVENTNPQPGSQVADSDSTSVTPGVNVLDTTSDTTDVGNLLPPSAQDRMVIPQPVAGPVFPVVLTSQERSNYLRGGLTFMSAYTDNALASLENTPVSDVSYSVAPIVALDETTPREHLILTYAPGFTFYQRTTSLNASDQNALIAFQYRLSPHVTFSATDGFQKSSSVFNQPDLTSAGLVNGGVVGANFSVIAPIADRLSNSGTAGLTYQFARNEMIGASGTFSNLHYPNPAQVPGLSDSGSQAGLAFYSLRLSSNQYFGQSYQYQRLVSYPTGGMSETQTQAALLFYTVYPVKGFSLSLFGGPQYSNTVQPLPQLPSRLWTPAGGASMSWQGLLNSCAVSFIHTISGGSGLVGAVQMDDASTSLWQQITKSLSGTLSGGYVQNNVLGVSLFGSRSGHSISGTASLLQQFGQHVALQLGYTRLYQSYSSVAVLSSNPNTNREFITLSYQFARALGR